MKKILFAPLLMLAVALPSHAATDNPDQLLTEIKADIAANRLVSPAGNNALEKIRKFREVAPYDFRISPLAYQWGGIYVDMAKKAAEQKDYAKAQGYLDVVWPIASLTPGLEAVQDTIDKNFKGQAQAVVAAPSAQELEKQRQVAAQAAAEKARVEADQKRALEEQRKQEALAKKQAEEELAKRQQLEKERRLAAEQAAAEAAKEAAKPVVQKAEAKVEPKVEAKPEPRVETAAKPAAPVVKPAAPVAPVAVAPVVRAPAAKTPARVAPVVASDRITQLWADAEEDSAPIASYPLDAKLLENRDRDGMAKALAPICKAIVDNEASVVVHSNDKAEYRWLIVRLTLCLRQEDKSFRLRHSYKDDANDGEPYITLHPMREVSLIKQVNES